MPKTDKGKCGGKHDRERSRKKEIERGIEKERKELERQRESAERNV